MAQSVPAFIQRLFHRGRWWPFHAVHHSTEELDWLGSVRVHPVNDLVNKLFQVSPLLLLGFNPWVTLSAAPFLTFYAIFLHANVNWDLGPLRGVIASPVFHRWHHSKDQEAWDKNFAGLLPIWDRLFGTYYMPEGRWPENFGIHDPMPSNVVGQMWVPFTWLLLEYRSTRKFSSIAFCTGAITGLVTVTPGAGHVPPWAAFLMGIAGTLASFSFLHHKVGLCIFLVLSLRLAKIWL
jgi:hypothetical protein